ncbi:hypothetical protein EGR_05195 [Echinococcus granulosus]|uniref:Uncharacterized protein n=1 Tax=Echinococcus granulosus TaxID=6210 RepID=W6V2B2_ECHGR|nr:hypothetical protein EGR_05195 [Echinococcus granulosus]EUB60034.1 hypothetical protein EGR_05195 [Echinococcus granulosus]
MSYEHHFFIDLLMANPLPKQSDKAAEEHAPAPSANQPKLCPQNVEECPPAPSAGQPGFRPQNGDKNILIAPVQVN